MKIKLSAPFETVKFSTPIEPVPFKRVLTNGKRRFNDKHYAEFKNALGLIAKAHMRGRPLLSGAIKICIEVLVVENF